MGLMMSDDPRLMIGIQHTHGFLTMLKFQLRITYESADTIQDNEKSGNSCVMTLLGTT